MNDNYSYYRIDDAATTILTVNLSLTANTIIVANSSILPTPNPGSAVPGVVFIDGERITYYTKDDNTNTLGQLRRGTAGTGAIAHTAGEIITDGSQVQLVPYSDNYTWTPNVDVVKETTSGLFYNFAANTTFVRSTLWYSPGTAPSSISTESFVAKTAANLITTESSIDITTEGSLLFDQSATDGNGLFVSGKIQAVFVRSA